MAVPSLLNTPTDHKRQSELQGRRYATLHRQVGRVLRRFCCLFITASSLASAGETSSPCLFDETNGPEMVVLEPGRFWMGLPEIEPDRRDDEQRHRVAIRRPFAMSRCEITFAEYDQFAQETARELPDDPGWGRGQRPVINVSWDDAQAYVAWLSERTGRRYRLPTEAEWEYAARAGTTTPFHTGNCLGTDQANYDGNYPLGDCPKGEYRGQTLPVGSFPANGFGLFDMHGNVWEWVQDCYGDYASSPIDGRAGEKENSHQRVLRGGSWYDFANNARSADRLRGAPDARDYNFVGFRVVVDLARTD